MSAEQVAVLKLDTELCRPLGGEGEARKYNESKYSLCYFEQCSTILLRTGCGQQCCFMRSANSFKNNNFQVQGGRTKLRQIYLL